MATDLLHINKEIVMLEYDTPENNGISSSAIEKYISMLEKNGNCMHGFVMIRHNKIIAEGAWKPFEVNTRHRMYSESKSYVSAAIGMLIGEGKLAVDDKIIKFFPEYTEKKEIHPYIAEMTVRDLLIMATPFSTQTYKCTDMNWIETFFAAEPSHPSGTVFNYDTSGSYILDVIVEKITGKPFLQYMREKFPVSAAFLEGAYCIKSPEGYSWGGSGVVSKMYDTAKLAITFMNKGRYDGIEIFPEQYAVDATVKQIENNTEGGNALYENGYGYQIWIVPNGFAFVGMGNQHAICIPGKDFLFVCTADSQGSSSHRTIIYEYLYSEIIDKITDRLPKDNEAWRRLISKCNSLEVHPIEGAVSNECAEKINDRIFILNKNRMNISGFLLSFEHDYGRFIYDTPRGKKEIIFGLGKYIEGYFPETQYSGNSINHPCGREYKCMSSAAWTTDNTFVIRTFITDDYFGNLTITISFKGNECGISMHKTSEWFLNEYEGFAGGTMK